MSFIRPLLSTLVERVRSDFEAWLPGADSRLRRSVLDVFARTHAGAAHGLYGAIDDVSRQILPDTADAENLARHAADHGVVRKAAVAARGPLTFSGTNGTVVPSGAFLTRSDGARFFVVTAGLIAAGAATVTIEAEVAGPDGNGPAGQSLTLVSPIAGVQSVAVTAAGGLIDGAAEESDADLLARLLLKLRNPPHGGNRADYIAWTLELAGVTRAWVYPGWMGVGSVGVAFVMDGRVDIIPLVADIEDVQDHLDVLRPVTADVTVFAPTPLPLTLSINAQPPTPEVEAAIEAEIRDLLFREAEPGGTLLISHIREAISIAPGEHDHQLIAPIGNVECAPGEMLVFGGILWAS